MVASFFTGRIRRVYSFVTRYAAAYIVGSTSSVRTVATKRPLAMATAIGPQKALGMSGTMPYSNVFIEEIIVHALDLIRLRRRNAKIVLNHQLRQTFAVHKNNLGRW